MHSLLPVCTWHGNCPSLCRIYKTDKAGITRFTLYRPKYLAVSPIMLEVHRFLSTKACFQSCSKCLEKTIVFVPLLVTRTEEFGVGKQVSGTQPLTLFNNFGMKWNSWWARSCPTSVSNLLMHRYKFVRAHSKSSQTCRGQFKLHINTHFRMSIL